ncbi:sugar phosphate isomerase/epimerase [Diaminobutyricimonas aerilata]|uniref:Sugar phosphate isomerase/epimerase n=1 Tax=Diaminobutyricimonas aerilata TaxID=1162967 RepID=A0A2M9CL28_9MICO|nr:sugar phosphate isomerase/epimerase family protein [Diaminobutyricimonas aerilata]PJJ72597.1 sugar phosphate isomerase/epimerase [Diaminobutyricimonas aerilata]
MIRQVLVQEQYLPGDTVQEKWDTAQQWGFDGIELRGRGDGAFLARLPELRRAAAAGIPMPTVCVEMTHFIGDFDADRGADARAQMTDQLRVIAEIGGRGAMTPASWGMFSRRLPPFEPPRTPEEDRAVLEDALGELGERAREFGVTLYLEPLNRYEDHMVNRLADAVALIEAIGSGHVRIGADTYHMNIEEADPAAALVAAGPYIGHVQASDSNRLEPGAGHIDWSLLGAALRGIGYDGPVAIESRLSGEAADVLPAVPPLLRRYL